MLKRKAYSYIRMSTDVQLKGDSLRRQLEASERYALDNNLELVDSIDGIPLKDIGVSGFLGKNTHKGVLAVFLEALQLGKIEPNSVLLIESLDRLSRDKLTEALTQFLNILDHGIEIVTLADNQRYTKEIINHNQGTLIISLTIMFRANEESEIKSKRVRAAWSNKRNNATNKPMTSRCPAWLRLVDGKFEVIPEKAAVIVMKIFELCISTCGLYGIARYFNENKVPVIGTTEIWQRSYIHKIITSRAVLGELQPYTTINGKRHQPAGDPIPNYYPQIIDEDTFYRANAAIARRNKSGRGRKGKTFSNLFSGLVYCSHCGSRITVRNHAPYKPWGKRLCCTNQRVGGGCTMPEWRLDSFQSMIFRHIHEVNFEHYYLTIELNEKDLDDEIDALTLSKLANVRKNSNGSVSFRNG